MDSRDDVLREAALERFRSWNRLNRAAFPCEAFNPMRGDLAEYCQDCGHGLADHTPD